MAARAEQVAARWLRRAGVSMASIVAATVIAAVVVTISLMGGVFADQSSPIHLPPSSSLAIMRHWTPRIGDVVFRASGDLVGDAIRERSGTAGRFSHVGIVVATGTRALVVLDDSPFGAGHAMLHGIAAFITEPTTSAVLVMRPRVAIDTAKLDAFASDLVRRHVPFDFAFDADDASALYCSELVFDVLRAGGVAWTGIRRTTLAIPLAGRRDVITPDALTRSLALQPVVVWPRLTK